MMLGQEVGSYIRGKGNTLQDEGNELMHMVRSRGYYKYNRNSAKKPIRKAFTAGSYNDIIYQKILSLNLEMNKQPLEINIQRPSHKMSTQYRPNTISVHIALYLIVFCQFQHLQAVKGKSRLRMKVRELCHSLLTMRSFEAQVIPSLLFFSNNCLQAYSADENYYIQFSALTYIDKFACRFKNYYLGN